MTFHVQQHIYVGTIRIEAINNSSMLQIGTSGGVSAISYAVGQPFTSLPDSDASLQDFYSPTLVPLPNPI